MKLVLTSFLFLFLVLFVSSSFAQRTVNVPPGFGMFSSVIDADTTSSGERVDSNTVYILERGGLYILDGEFSPRYQCFIEAAAGAGERPKIILGVPSGGVTPDQTIRPRANFSIKGCYISAQDELGGVSTRIFRFEENGIRIVIDDCVLDLASQAAFRINTSDNSLYMTNSIISNIGLMDSPENGRAFDDRGNDVDTLYVENCTLYNLTFKVLRDGGGRINYAYFNHNTIVNTGFGCIDLGEVLTANISNNIIINGNFVGANPATGDYVINMLPWSGGETPDITIKNNNIFDDPDLVAVFPDSVGDPIHFDSLSSLYVDSSTNISEALSFTDGPESPIAAVTAYFQDPASVGGFLDTAGHANFDFSYPTTAASYTAGTGAQPLGDLSWFGMTVGINDENYSSTPDAFQLFNNYPNPFNPSTTIEYKISKASHVALTIFNSLGEEVAEIVNMQQNPGTYSVKWDGTNSFGHQVVSGIYFYRLNTDNFSSTKKMILLK